jgi:prevent-host-death family protein
MDIGVREFKQNLSKYLKRAAAGESSRVTERGVPKAVIGPIPGRVRLEEGVAEGWITVGENAGAANAGRRKIRRAKSKRRSSDALQDDRGR